MVLGHFLSFFPLWQAGVQRAAALSQMPEGSALKGFFSLVLRAACGDAEQGKEEVGAQPQAPG